MRPYKTSAEQREKERLRKASYRKRKGVYQRKVIESEEGKRQVRLDRKVYESENLCPVCGLGYKTRRADKKYCSHVCRDYANKGFDKYGKWKDGLALLCYDQRTSTIIARRHGKLPSLFDYRPDKAPAEKERRKRLKQLLHSLEQRNFFANRSSVNIKPSEFRDKKYVHYLISHWCTEEEKQTLYRKYLPKDQRR